MVDPVHPNRQQARQQRTHQPTLPSQRGKELGRHAAPNGPRTEAHQKATTAIHDLALNGNIPPLHPQPHTAAVEPHRRRHRDGGQRDPQQEAITTHTETQSGHGRVRTPEGGAHTTPRRPRAGTEAGPTGVTPHPTNPQEEIGSYIQHRRVILYLIRRVYHPIFFLPVLASSNRLSPLWLTQKFLVE